MSVTEQGKKDDAGKLLLWHAIKDCSTFVDTFDFEGSMLKGVEYYFRRFGTTQMPYFQISKFNSRVLKAIFTLFGKI